MDTAQHLTQYLRRETGYDRLLAAPNPNADRWCVFELRRRCSGGWEIPFRITDAGEIVRREPATMRMVIDVPELIYVHEIDGKYAEANPHLILEALRKQDKWTARDIARDMVERVKANREKRREETRQMFGDLAQEHRRLFAQAAEEMGL